jgi:hypothetical protein
MRFLWQAKPRKVNKPNPNLFPKREAKANPEK